MYKLQLLDKLVNFLLYYDDVQEEWREIPKTNGKYFVSNKGNVLSLCRRKAKVLKPYVCSTGYYYVDINRRNVRINRLVAQAFLPPPNDDKCIVHHKDHNKLNNNVNNLEWVTQKENMQKFMEYKKELEENGETV